MLTEISDPNKFDELATHITQSWKWGEFRKKTGQVKKVLRLGSATRGFQIFFHRVPFLPFTIAYLPRSEMPTSEELLEIKQLCRQERSILLKIEPLRSFASAGIKGRPILPQHTIYLDLTLSEEKILAEMHEKTRYNIRLAEKRGVVVKKEDTSFALENFIKLLEKTESRQGFYSHYPEYYRILWQTLSSAKMVYLLSAYISNTPIAAIMLFRFKDFLYYPYGGSNPAYREFMAPNLLHWEAIKLGKKLDCQTYDLWGSYKEKPGESDPWWGIYRFKSGFGGKEVDFPSTRDIPLSPLYLLYPLADSLRWFFLKR